MSTRGKLRLATRGSDLALRQAASVAEALSGRRYEVELVEVETRGDELRDELIHRLGKTGAFVRALDERVLSGEADAAVHSMKDVPTELPAELDVAGVPERAPAGDVLVTSDGRALSELPEGATVGTSSLRRRAQLLAERPDLTVEPVRGNVDTRVEKLLAPSLQREHQRLLDGEESGDGGGSGDGRGADDEDPSPEAWFEGLAEVERRALERDSDVEYDAVVLAEAGLRRTGLLDHVEFFRLPTARFVPAAGQGALAVVAADDDVTAAIRESIDSPHTRVASTVERTVLAELGGGCIAPIGIHAVLQGEYVHTVVRVLSRDGTEAVESTRDLPADRHVEAAVEFAADLRARGAADLIERARRELDAEDAAADAAGEGASGAEREDPARDESDAASVEEGEDAGRGESEDAGRGESEDAGRGESEGAQRGEDE